jgi:Rad3-related DNA helicase
MKLNFDKVMKLFPLEKPRDIQVQAIRDIVGSYNNDAEFVISEVPVGGGKSGIAIALARALGDNSYILTLTEQLQNQYVRDFSDLGVVALKGRGKFHCTKLGGESTCADGKLELSGSSQCPPDRCPYQVAKADALNSPHTVANYHSYLYNVGMGAGRKPKRGEPKFDFDVDSPMRELTVIDEAHAMENFLLDVVSLTVKVDKLPFAVGLPPNERSDFEPYRVYLINELQPRLAEYLEKSAKRGTLDSKTKDELGQLAFKIADVLKSAEEEAWVPEREEVRDGSGRLIQTSFALKPLYVRRYGRWLTGFGKFKLLMSGTILNAHKVAESVGLDPEKGDAFVYDSPFPVENRPVYVGNLSMKMKDRDDSWPIMVKMVANIFNAHPTEKGLLLVPSNAMLDYIIKNLPGGPSGSLARRIIKASGGERMDNYQRHIDSKSPSVLGAPGFWEGADLKGDASRFQIIPAIPRAFWQGQVAARAAKDHGWYDWVNYTKLLQGFGRSVRSETDTAVTYLFDRDFRVECKRSGSLIPKWVRDSVQLVD